MKIDFKTCKMDCGNKWVVIKNRFDSLFKQNQKQGFARFEDNGKYGWVNRTGEPIGGLHDWTFNFENNFASFKDKIDDKTKLCWINLKGEQIGDLHDLTFNFENNFAQFKDEINGKDKWGWVNRKGEPIGSLHDGNGHFENDFAWFKDEIDGEEKCGYIDKYGIEYYTDLDNARKTQELIIKDFPLDSMKFYIFRKIYD